MVTAAEITGLHILLYGAALVVALGIGTLATYLLSRLVPLLEKKEVTEKQTSARKSAFHK